MKPVPEERRIMRSKMFSKIVLGLFFTIFTCEIPGFPVLFAQDPFGGQPPPPGLVSAVGRKLIESTAEGTTSTAMFLSAMNNQEMQKDFGFTEEQKQHLKSLNARIQAEMVKNIPRNLERFKNYNPDVEKEILAEIQDGIQKVRGRIDQFTTPEQKEKAKTLSFQAFGGLDSPFVNMDMVSSLDLSEEQKQKAQKMFEETEKERREIMEAGLKLAEKAVSYGGPGKMTPEQRNEVEQEAKALEGRVFASGKKLGASIRSFLTDAQKKKAEELMENRPSYLGPLPRQLRKNQDGEGEWKPDESSWEPGQGVEDSDPEPPRERRFPSRRKPKEQPEE